MKHVLWTSHVTICFIWILPALHLNYKTLQLLKALNLNLFLILKTYFNWTLPVSHLKTHPALKFNLFLILRSLWSVTSLHQQMFSVYNMTMTCSYSIKRLILHLTISIIKTFMSMKIKIKMTFSFMPPTLATALHCRILGLTALNSLLQYVNWLVWEVCSVN